MLGRFHCHHAPTPKNPLLLSMALTPDNLHKKLFNTKIGGIQRTMGNGQ